MATTVDSAYATCEAGTRRIHALIDEGRGEDDETNRIREQCADVWHELTNNQRESLRKLSQSFNDARNARG